MQLKGLKINFLGDSITEGASASRPENIYFNVLKQNEGVAVCRNYGVGGTRIARQTTPSENPAYDEDFLARCARMDEDADLIVVFGGTNDFDHGDAQFGTFHDKDVYTFYGALRTLIETLLVRYPQSRLVFLTPLHREHETGVNGKPHLAQYVQAIREVCAYYAVPVCDLFATSGIQPAFPPLRERYTSDGLHPNDVGHALIAQRLAGFLKSL